MILLCASNYLNRTIPKRFLKTANSLTLFQHSCGMPETFNCFLLRDASFLHSFPRMIGENNFHTGKSSVYLLLFSSSFISARAHISIHYVLLHVLLQPSKIQASPAYTCFDFPVHYSQPDYKHRSPDIPSRLFFLFCG